MRSFSVHRLVATVFIPNPKEKEDINHINGDKTDNRVVNLEWATKSENQKHAWNNGLNKMTDELKAVRGKKVICVETGVEYDTISQASKLTNINRGNIGVCCSVGNNRKTAGGYHWKYKDAE